MDNAGEPFALGVAMAMVVVLAALAGTGVWAAVVSTFFVAAYVGLGLPAVLTGLLSLPIGPVDASAWVSGLAAVAVALAFVVVRRSFGTAAIPRPAARPCDSWCSPAEPARISAPS
jgi:hypothetical protein